MHVTLIGKKMINSCVALRYQGVIKCLLLLLLIIDVLIATSFIKGVHLKGKLKYPEKDGIIASCLLHCD